MAGQPVLNLDSLIDRPVVIIGGAEYRLWTIDLLPPLDNYRVRRLIARGDALAMKEDLTPAEQDELAGSEVDVLTATGTVKQRRGGVMDAIVRIVLDAPADVHEKLTDKHRSEIIRTFQMPSLDLLMKLLAAANPAGGPSTTGETSPPVLPPPTAEAPTASSVS